MPTSTVRAVIVVAAVVVGVVILTKAFPSAAPIGGAAPGASPSASPTTTHSPTLPTTNSSSPAPSASPRVAGVVVQVLNGSHTTGLAGDTTNTLKDAGYTLRTPDNAPFTATTTVYYASDSKTAAQYLQEKYFPEADLKPAPSTFAADVQITIVLGQDFADSASASPSPTPT